MISEKLRQKRPAFFTRLSNLILLQVFFIFAAFGLLFLYPVEEEITTANPSVIESKFKIIGEEIAKCSQQEKVTSCQSMLEKSFQTSMNHLDYLNSNVFILDSNQVIISLLTLDENDYNSADYYNQKIIKSELLRSGEHLLQNIPSTQNIVYYYTFHLNKTQKALFVVEFEHHYFVTSESKVLYVFGLLFLGGILISLLTIYLIRKRVQEPLARLMKGFEKTTQGDLYYMVETNKDAELNKLTESFNKMSQTLWDKDQKLKKYNSRLKEVNNKLMNSRQHLRKVLDNSSSSIITTSPDGIVQMFNETASEHFQLSTEQAVGVDINNLFADGFNFKILDDNSQDQIEVVCKRNDGTVFPAFLLFAPIYDNELNLSAWLYVMQDITESKTIHNMMVQMDRYYVKGEMAGDIAHEINNFLAILSGNIELMPLILKKNDPEKITKKLELMKKQVDRIVNFTDGLLEANDGDDSFVQVDMNQLLLAVKSFLQPQNLFDYVEIEMELSDELPLVYTQIGHVRQMFVNLVYNAGESIESLEGEKSIKIKSILTGSDDNKTVTITVSDNGAGVAKENREYLFKKRFTTKAHGHGISLVACQKIVDTHSGTLEYEYNDGASFRVVLPVHQDVEQSDEPCDSRYIEA